MKKLFEICPELDKEIVAIFEDKDFAEFLIKFENGIPVITEKTKKRKGYTVVKK